MKRAVSLLASLLLITSGGLGCAGTPAGRSDDTALLRLGRGLIGPWLMRDPALIPAARPDLEVSGGSTWSLPPLWHVGEQRRGPVSARLVVVPPAFLAFRQEKITPPSLASVGRSQRSWQLDAPWPLLCIEQESRGWMVSEAEAAAAAEDQRQPRRVWIGADRFRLALLGVFSLNMGANELSWHVAWPLGFGYESDRNGRWLRFLGFLRVKITGPVRRRRPPAAARYHDHRRSARLWASVLEARRRLRRLSRGYRSSAYYVGSPLDGPPPPPPLPSVEGKW